MRTSVLIQLKQFLKKYEGVCDFMYLDKKMPKGLVTTGIGNLIDPIRFVHEYKWVWKSGNRRASRKEVEHEWNHIKRLQQYKLRGGGYYKRFTRLKLAPGEIDRIFSRKANQFNNQLKKIFPKWETYPDEAQVAMLIHAWANGAARLKTEWREYYKACSSNNWVRAASECRWKRIELGRLKYMQQLFHEAAKKYRRPLGGVGVRHRVVH